MLPQMSDLLLLVHPPALACGGAAAAAVIGRAGSRRWPGWPIALAWTLAPALFNPLFWFLGAPLMGWKMGGLGGLLYLGYVLPLNGLALGVASVPLLTALFGRERDGVRLFAPGFLLQLLLLSGWLAAASQIHAYVGNLQA